MTFNENLTKKDANKEVTTHTIIIIDHSHDYYLTGGCVFIVYVILLKLKQVYNMSRSQCCPLYCHGGGRRAPHRWQANFSRVPLGCSSV